LTTVKQILMHISGQSYFMLIITNKMQHNTLFFILVTALHVSGGFPAHRQELKNCTYRIWYLSSLYAATAQAVAAYKLDK